MNSIRWMICCFVALGAFANLSLRAEEEVGQFLSGGLDVHGHQHDQQPILDRQNAKFKRHLDVRVGELKRVCDLDEKQVKKLEVAAKGAVEEAMTQFLDRFPQLKAQAQRQLLPPAALAIAKQKGAANVAVAPQGDVAVVEADVIAPRVDDEPVADADLAPQVQIDVAPVAEAPLGDVFGAPQVAPQVAPAQPAIIWNVHQNFQMEPSEVTNTVVWRNAVKQVLTEAQKESYRTSQTERRMFRRQTIVDRVVASVDRRLFLSQEQRKELANVIHDVLGDNLDNLVPHGGLTSDSMVAAQVVAQIPKEKLNGVLDPAQIESWDDVQQVQQGIVFGLR